jgi:hypothetical protein
MRCKPSGARSPRSAVGLSVLPSRCLLMGSHYEHAELILEGGKESPLTVLLHWDEALGKEGEVDLSGSLK